MGNIPWDALEFHTAFMARRDSKGPRRSFRSPEEALLGINTSIQEDPSGFEGSQGVLGSPGTPRTLRCLSSIRTIAIYDKLSPACVWSRPGRSEVLRVRSGPQGEPMGRESFHNLSRRAPTLVDPNSFRAPQAAEHVFEWIVFETRHAG